MGGIDTIDAIETIDTIGAIGGIGDFFGCATTDPLEAHCSRFTVSKLRSAMPRLHGVFHDMPSPMAGLAGPGVGLARAMGLVFYDVIALGGEVFFCAGF